MRESQTIARGAADAATGAANPIVQRPPASRHGRAAPAIDMLLVAAACLIVFVVGARVEFYEIFSRWVVGYEHWQADEAPLALMVLSVGLAWFSWRRWRETRREVASRAEAERHIAQLLRHNRELSQQLLTLQEGERRALARELHDELGQCCNAIRVDAACILNTPEGRHPTVEPSARAIADTADALYRSVHRMVRRLRPEALDAVGLNAALQELCAEWQQRQQVAVSFTCEVELEGLPEPYSITIYRLVQEALTNVARHAHADWVRIDLRGARAPGAALHLTVQDNGRGMDADTITGGLGLLGMRERVAALSGAMDVRSRSGAGVVIDVVLPLPAEEDRQ